MTYYTKQDIETLEANKKGTYYTSDKMLPKTMRVELKMAYLSLLNELLVKPTYNEEGNAYLECNLKTSASSLATLANKKVDEAKIEGYINELVEAQYLEVVGQQLYLLKR